jgi:hypothetical protein
MFELSLSILYRIWLNANDLLDLTRHKQTTTFTVISGTNTHVSLWLTLYSDKCEPVAPLCTQTHSSTDPSQPGGRLRK